MAFLVALMLFLQVWSFFNVWFFPGPGQVVYVVYQAAQSYYRFLFGSNDIPRKLGANTLDNVEKFVHFNLKIDAKLTTSKNIYTG